MRQSAGKRTTSRRSTAQPLATTIARSACEPTSSNGRHGRLDQREQRHARIAAANHLLTYLLTLLITNAFASSHVKRGKDTHGTTGPELGTRGMRGSKPAGFTGVGERAARSLDRVSRRRGPRRAAGASLEQRDLLDDVCRVREHSRGHDAGEVVGEVVRRVEAAVGGAVAPALPA